MKRLSETRRRWFQIRARKCAFRVQKRKAKRLGIVSVIRPATGGWLAIPSGKNIGMPEVMSFDKGEEKTLEAINSVRNRLALPMRGIRMGSKTSKYRKSQVRQGTPYFMFENILNITPSVALILAAEFEVVKIKTGSLPTIFNIEGWNTEVIYTLFNLGFFDIVGVPTGMKPPDLSRNSVILPMKSGETADGEAVGDLVASLQALYPGDSSAAHSLTHLYGAMIEAVVNVSIHAYPPGASLRLPAIKRWWMTGAVDKNAGWTTAVIYDRGITIPVSLPHWHRYAGVAARLQRLIRLAPAVGDKKSDGSAIAMAVEEAISSTKELHRGHGLAQMRDFLDECRDGYLRIMSRCGEVIYRPGASPEIKTHDISIGGTLIEWNVLV